MGSWPCAECQVVTGRAPRALLWLPGQPHSSSVLDNTMADAGPRFVDLDFCDGKTVLRACQERLRSESGSDHGRSHGGSFPAQNSGALGGSRTLTCADTFTAPSALSLTRAETAQSADSTGWRR
jgi:hypothetical protein